MAEDNFVSVAETIVLRYRQAQQGQRKSDEHEDATLNKWKIESKASKDDHRTASWVSSQQRSSKRKPRTSKQQQP